MDVAIVARRVANSRVAIPARVCPADLRTEQPIVLTKSQRSLVEPALKRPFQEDHIDLAGRHECVHESPSRYPIDFLGARAVVGLDSRKERQANVHITAGLMGTMGRKKPPAASADGTDDQLATIPAALKEACEADM